MVNNRTNILFLPHNRSPNFYYNTVQAFLLDHPNNGRVFDPFAYNQSFHIYCRNSHGHMIILDPFSLQYCAYLNSHHNQHFDQNQIMIENMRTTYHQKVMAEEPALLKVL